MSYRTIFDEAIGEAPPTSIDLDRITAQQSRLIRLRRIGMSGGAAAAVLAIAVGTVAVTGQSTDRVPVPAVSRSVSPPPPLPSLPAEVTVKYDVKVRDRITAAARAALRENLPGLQWVPESDILAPPTERQTFWTSLWSGGGSRATGYVSSGNVMAGGRRANVMISVEWAQRSSVDQLTCSPPVHGDMWFCNTRIGEDGERILQATSFPLSESRHRLPGPDAPEVTTTPTRGVTNEWTRLDLRLLRPDGMFVTVHVSAWGQQSPLTLEQALTIARDPSLTLR